MQPLDFYLKALQRKAVQMGTNSCCPEAGGQAFREVHLVSQTDWKGRKKKVYIEHGCFVAFSHEQAEEIQTGH